MNKSLKLDQQTFLHVKQRLDYYKLPTSFPIEATGLLSRLLGLIDGELNDKLYQKENLRYQQLRQSNQSCYNSKSTSSFNPMIDQALRLQLSKHIQQNNSLHTQIMTLKQELSSLKHSLSKSTVQNLSLNKLNNQQHSIIEQNHIDRERQLFDELQDAKYKYNQLLDWVHSEGNTDKEYIKKLLKHKKYCSGQSHEYDNEKSSKQRTRGVTTNDFIKQTRKSNQRMSSNYQLELLKQKLQNRQNEILRLQRKLQFDGLNMNRILKDFNQSKSKQQQQKTNQRLKHLQKQYKQTKDQSQKMKRQGGDKQALRQHVQKLKAQNTELKQKLQAQKKRTKQIEYDQKKQKRQNSRKLNQTADKLNSLMKQKAKDDTKDEQLQKKQTLLQAQVKQLQHEVAQLHEQVSQLKQTTQKLSKQLQNQKLMKQYQRQKFTRKQTELTQQLAKMKLKDQLNNLELLRQNQMLKQTIENLQKANEEIVKRSDFVNESTNIMMDRTVSENHAVSEFYKQELNELRSKLYQKDTQLNKNQNQIIALNLIIDKIKKQLQINKSSNNTLQLTLITNNKLQSTIDQLTHQYHHQKDLLQLQKTKTIKYQAQLTQCDKINHQFNVLKEQYFSLQKGEKEKIRVLEVRIAELEEIINLKVMRCEEKDCRIGSLEKEIMSNNQRLRQANKELTALDDELHQLRMEKNRLQKKHAELLIDYSSKKENQKSNALLKEAQLLTQMQKLVRDLQKNKMITEEQRNEIHEYSILKGQMDKQVQEMEKSLEAQKQQIQNYKQRQQLYEMEIRELKSMTGEN